MITNENTYYDFPLTLSIALWNVTYYSSHLDMWPQPRTLALNPKAMLVALQRSSARRLPGFNHGLSTSCVTLGKALTLSVPKHSKQC